MKHEPKSTKKIESREITAELRESYLDYAMSVIVSRALPDVRDGLKPVQRRILWAMWSLGLTHTAKFMKSARVTGETMGKYHPHGDAAVYDAMVRMAQDFSLRYPLIDGQGNFGSVDGDNAAAQRYTEARLSKIAEELLVDIEKETVDWKPNYDNSRREPKLLPAKLPNLLINGTMGIAVGMATSIPPHNLVEVVDALVYLSDHSDASVGDLMKFIPGPDFPTGGIIYDRRSIEEAYTTGRGSVTIRAAADIEERKSGSYQIVITEIPYQVNKADLITKIASLVQDKKIVGIRDVRDESDRDGLRIVVELKGGNPPQKILNQLFQYSELQKNFYFNVLALVDGLQPRTLSLKDVLAFYLDHRKIVVRRRVEFDLKKAEERAHVLVGLAKALKAIDRVVSTIKKSKDKETARKNLMKSFALTVIQANAILEMRLQTLAALERKKIEDELLEKKKRIAELKLILKSPKKIVGIVKNELLGFKKDFPEPRRTKLIASSLKEFREEDLIPNEDTIIALTRGGYIKRMAPTVFKTQKRGGKGLIGSELKEEDVIDRLVSTRTHDNILFFTDRGRVFQTKVYEIPTASRTARGKSIYNFLEIPANENVSAVVSYADDGGRAASRARESAFLVMATTKGLIKKTPLKDFGNVRRTGIIAIRLNSDDLLKWVKLSSDEDQIIVVTSFGQAIRFKEKEVRTMGRGAAGVGAIRLKKGDSIAGFDIIIKTEKGTPNTKDRLLVVMANGFAKQTPLKEYKLQKRGGSGMKTAKVTYKTGHIIAARIVGEETEEILVFSSKGQALRTELKNVRTASRSTQGVRIINLKKTDTLAGVICLTAL